MVLRHLLKPPNLCLSKLLQACASTMNSVEPSTIHVRTTLHQWVETFTVKGTKRGQPFWSTKSILVFWKKRKPPFGPWKKNIYIYIQKGHFEWSTMKTKYLWSDTENKHLTKFKKHSNNWKSSHDHGEEVECHSASLKPWIPGRKVGVELNPGVVNLGLGPPFSDEPALHLYIKLNLFSWWNLREKNLFLQYYDLFFEHRSNIPKFECKHFSAWKG